MTAKPLPNPDDLAFYDQTGHLRSLISQAPGFVAVLIGREHVVEMANDAWCQMVGRRDIVGRPLFEAAPGVAGLAHEELLKRVFESGQPYVGHGAKATLERPGQPAQDVYIDFVYQPIVADGGEVVGVFVQGHDVTDAHAAQMAKQVVDQRLRDGLDMARMTVWDWDLASGKVVYSNNAAMVFGFEWENVDEAWQCVHPDDAEHLREVVGKAIAERGSYNVANRLVRPDTCEVVWLNNRGHVLCGADGQPRVLRGVSVDITERKRAEMELERVNLALAERVRALGEAERRNAFQLEVSDLLRSLSDPPAIFKEVTRLLGRYLRVSRVLCADYDLDQRLVTYHSNYIDKGAAALNGTWPAPGFGAANFASLEGGATWVSADMEHDPRTSGEDTWPTFKALDIYSGVVVPLIRRGTMIACLIVNESQPRKWTADEVRLIEDCADRMWVAVERVRAEEALRQADLRKDEFLAMLAHELRNPLAPISAAAELLRVGRLDAAGIQKTSQVIARQVGHMTGLVNDLLDVSRVTRGLVVLDKATVDIQRVVAEAVEQIRPLLEARAHRLSVHVPPDAACVLGDHKRLVQVLANLLANSAKYTPERGDIQMRMELEAEQVALAVSDNGIGIAPDVLPHVFDLFAQAQRTPDRSQGGLGLGLALVKSLVELHGGSVAAHSEGHGAGSEFVVTLPRLSCAACVPQSEAHCGAQAVGAQPLRVLVVDDNGDAASMLELLLERSGYQVMVEHHAGPALERARREAFDVFLLDIGLPGIDGRELARRLRQMPCASRSLLVAVTGYGQRCDKANALASGFDDYFIKPVDTARLLALLASVRPAASCMPQ